MTDFDPKTNVETWETTTAGTVWVWIKDPRDPQGYRKQRVGGKSGGSRTLRITTDDRRFNQEQVVEEMRDQDPFVNGLLRKTDDKHVDDVISTYHMSNDDLIEMLEIKDESIFESEVREITSELILRRLASVAEKTGTVWQMGMLKELIEERYAVGGTQQSIREQDTPGYKGANLRGQQQR